MEGKLRDFKVGDLPTVMYIPDFIDEIEETHLLNKINEAPLSKWKTLKNRRLQNWGGVVHEKGLLPQELPSWLTKITQRIYEESGLFPAAINHVLINEYLPNQGIMPHQDGPSYFPVVAILSLGSPVVMDFSPHSRLSSSTNALRSDDDKSSDGESLEVQVGENEWIDNHHPFSVLLMPRSLLIFKDDAYSDYLHGIQDSEVQQYDKVINEASTLMHHTLQSMLDSETPVEVVRKDLKCVTRTRTRISLTCRLVLKVHKNLFKI